VSFLIERAVMTRGSVLKPQNFEGIVVRADCKKNRAGKDSQIFYQKSNAFVNTVFLGCAKPRTES